MGLNYKDLDWTNLTVCVLIKHILMSHIRSKTSIDSKKIPLEIFLTVI